MLSATSRLFRVHRAVNAVGSVRRRTLVQSADEVSSRVARVLHDYRKHGHAYANVNPIESAATPFRTQLYGLLESDVIADRTLTTAEVSTVGELVAHLNRVYCNTLALEADHLESEEGGLVGR